MKRLFIVALAAVLAFAFWSPPAIAPAATPPDWQDKQAPSPAPVGDDFVPGEIIVKFKDNTPEQKASEVEARHGLREREHSDKLGARLMEAPKGQEKEIIARLASEADVESAEPNYRYHAFFVPNDTYYSQYQWNLSLIGMPVAWDISRGNPSVKVAVIDTGVDGSHPDGPVNLMSGYDYVSQSFDSSDQQGHGTFVSGIIAAATNNGIGLAGMAPAITEVMYKEIDPTSGTFDSYNISNAITNAASNNVKVISMSLGGPYYSSTMQSAVNYAWNRGVFVVAAAGNCGSGSPSSDCASVNEIEYPAGYSNVMAVGATTSSDTIASFSTQNSTVDVSAPGSGVYSLAMGGGYANGSGTSFATPHVAALAALILSANPALTNKQVGDIILATSQDLGIPGRDNAFGAGRINAAAALVQAVSFLNPTPTPTVTPRPSPTSTPTPVPTPISGAYRTFFPEVHRSP